MANANDTFTEAADTDLALHTSDSGHAWTKDNGNVLTVNAVGDYLYNAAPTNASRYSLGVTPATAEYDVQGDIVSAVNWAMGLMARIDEPATDDYRCYFESSSWKLLKRDAGIVTELGTYTGDSPNGTPRTVKLEIRDATKKLFIGGVERISSTDNTVTAAGKPGLISLGIDSSEHLDNWSSTDVASGSSGTITVTLANFSPSLTGTTTVTGSVANTLSAFVSAINGTIDVIKRQDSGGGKRRKRKKSFLIHDNLYEQRIKVTTEAPDSVHPPVKPEIFKLRQRKPAAKITDIKPTISQIVPIVPIVPIVTEEDVEFAMMVLDVLFVDDAA